MDGGHVPRPDPAVIGLERIRSRRLRLSIIDSRTDAIPRALDLLVDSPPEATFGDLRGELLQLLRHDGHDDLSPEGVTFEVDGRPLADDAPLGTPPLLRGAFVVAAPRHRSRMPSGSVGLTAWSSWAARVRVGRSRWDAGTTSSVVRPRARCGSRPGRLTGAQLLTVGDGYIAVRDLHPANPSRLDGERPPTGGAQLTPGAFLRVGSSTLLMRQRSMTPVRHGARDGRVLVHVRPRFVGTHPRVEVHTPEEPRRPDGHRLPVLTSLAPLVLSGALALAMHSPVMLLFALMSPVILLGQWWSDRRHGRLSHRRMLRQHADSLEAVASRTSAALEAETRQRRAEQP